jgi:hypothetical protein
MYLALGNVTELLKNINQLWSTKNVQTKKLNINLKNEFIILMDKTVFTHK